MLCLLNIYVFVENCCDCEKNSNLEILLQDIDDYNC